MKKFREYIAEEMLPYAQTEKSFVGVDNGPVRDNINIHLTSITARPYATPYHALEMVRKVLAPFHIGLPSTNFLDGDSGHEIFEINQFGEKIGMRDNGDVVTKNASSYFVYFEYAMNDKGSFDIFSEIVNQEELDDILSDVESEMEPGDREYYQDEGDASDSYEMYKSKNNLTEVSKEYLSKKSSKGFDLQRKYIWKDDYKRADKKQAQMDKIRAYMKKKGMSSASIAKKEPDELQKRYDELVYKGD